MRTIQEHISVVIPTLNAADVLPMTLRELEGLPILGEIVIADGGSADGTTAVALAAGARIIVAPRGRGTQLAAGAEAATGEWLLFLHADCRPGRGWQQAVERFIDAARAETRAGYFDFALDDDSKAARRLEGIVAWRCRALALPYGDQGLLIARDLYEAVGGFAPLPLMEDVDLARRLGRTRLAPVGVPLYASARRYRREGYVPRSLRNLLCLSLYLAGVAPHRLVRLYR